MSIEVHNIQTTTIQSTLCARDSGVHLCVSIERAMRPERGNVLVE